jgi:catechol 2,3-dioxygenase-like lactoylglutathione lyase family enzyme
LQASSGVFDHVTIRVSDRSASERFYATVLDAVGIEQDRSLDWIAEWGEFSLSPSDADHPPTRRLHIGFGVGSREQADAFWRAGTEAGYRDDGAPGPRPQYTPDYYGGFLLDPDGNSAEAVHHSGVTPGGIDHLWIRVSDVAGTQRFYAAVVAHAGLRMDDDTSDRVRFRSERSSVTFLDGTPTEHVHLAFPVSDDATVQAFHRDLVAQGYRDNGGPGERPEYHPGYYGAFVLDPDGHNVELVNHHRD